ncbi:DeoR family transcriptional regulator [Bacillus atrophaeus]|uniref:DeoR family transcriptional regulator n=1 Tax=Bacillus atrophaeus TaxID=1452 RepID=UPI00227EE003|nr:DeoR family transcriptional regulator [Bacillus atrophaeus]MCY8496411.1 DeoR family transcriptional regulator [Bacillus atrophaeus]MCY8809932.1 DeoR family transcriptional regulator [Bacillus atrophaeus]MCY8814374.1 DeoR family transcriptional regulator [Bacillus atrophaeus]MCY8821284.1 DeoR family transcriptional regulator [Bacillus atrophaeus]MCY8828749.1 DeoR family transcriptional regulator [Bacillus atrophaeus]
MLPINRQQKLIEWLKEEGALRIADISARFGVSEMTVYRDVNQLAKTKQVIKTSGGIALAENSSLPAANLCSYCLKPVNHTYSVQLITVGQEVEQLCCAHCAFLRYEDKKEEVSHLICKDFLLQTTVSAASAVFLLHAELDLHCCQPQAIPFASLDHAERFQKGFGGTICTFDKALEIILNDRQKGCACTKT